MYVIASSYFNASNNTVHYTSLGGHFQAQITYSGIEKNSSLVRGYLLATLQGLDKIEAQHGLAKRYRVDVFIPDQAIAELIEQKKSLGPLHGDNDDLFRVLIDYRKKFELHFVNEISEGSHLDTIFRWSSRPPVEGVLPASSSLE